MYTISVPRYTVISVIEDVVSCCIDHVALIIYIKQHSRSIPNAAHICRIFQRSRLYIVSSRRINIPSCSLILTITYIHTSKRTPLLTSLLLIWFCYQLLLHKLSNGRNKTAIPDVSFDGTIIVALSIYPTLLPPRFYS